MKAKIITSITGLLISLLAPLAVLVPRAAAAAVTWDGEGADNNWSTAANWSGDTVPVDGDSLVFDVTSLTAHETLNNDLTNLSVAGITRTGTNATSSSYELDGNAITLTGPIVGSNVGESGQIRVKFNITLGSNVTFANMNNVYLDEGFDLSTFDLTLQAADSNAMFNLFNLAGSGDISIDGGTSYIGGIGDATYSGSITVVDGNLTVSPNSVKNASAITVSGTGSLTISGAGTFDAPLTLGGSGGTCWGPDPCVLSISDDLTLAGGVTLTSDIGVSPTGVLTVGTPYTPGSFSMTVTTGSTGSIKLPGGAVVEPEAKTTTIAANDKSNAAVNVWNKETVIVNGERGSAYVYEGGILKGTGTITGTVSVTDGGTLAPGESPGCLTMGGLTITGNYDVELAGTTACTQYDQSVVNGTVDVTGATLNVSFLNDYEPADNAAFMIINNDAADAVTGTFAGLDDGSTFTVDGYTLQINYNGGDGNDVMLLVTEVPAAPDTGIESLVRNPIITLSAALAVLGVLGVQRFATKRS